MKNREEYMGDNFFSKEYSNLSNLIINEDIDYIL